MYSRTVSGEEYSTDNRGDVGDGGCDDGIADGGDDDMKILLFPNCHASGEGKLCVYYSTKVVFILIKGLKHIANHAISLILI